MSTNKGLSAFLNKNKKTKKQTAKEEADQAAALLNAQGAMASDEAG